jgi:hypothetical protein
MVESGDLQGAVQRTLAMERLQALEAQQEELNRKRFELESDRQRAERRKKVQDSQRVEEKPPPGDRYDGNASPEGRPREPGTEAPGPGERPDEGTGRHVDVRA